MITGILSLVSDFTRSYKVYHPLYRKGETVFGILCERPVFLCRLTEVEPDVNQLRLRPEDAFVILASDGLWDVLEDSDAVAIAKKSLAKGSVEGSGGAGGLEAQAKAACDALVTEALARGTLDNVTAVLLLLQWD